MKKIAFFAYNMEMGGAEKSLVNTINYLNKDYKIDLYLYDKKGELLNDLPNNINIIEIKKNNFMYFLFKYFKNYRKKYLNKIMIDKYDFLVAFVEGRLATIINEIDMDAKRFAWIHTNVNKYDIGISTKEIIASYKLVDKIVFVSLDSLNNFYQKYHLDKNKMIVIPNIIDINDIMSKSHKEVIPKNKFTFINVSKMRPEKRHDLMIDACKILKNEGYQFEFWLIGDGVLFNDINNLIKENNLEDTIKLWGLKNNPYPYVLAADAFVLASDYEGQPLVILESLILKKPVISTDIPVVNKLLDNKYGLTCNHDSKSLAKAMKELLNESKYKEINQKLMKLDLKYDNLFKEMSDLFEKGGRSNSQKK